MVVSFLGSTLFAQTPIEWVNLKNATLSNTTLTKGTGTRGMATSTNMLYGAYNATMNNGSISFSSGSVANEVKTVGFTISENELIGFETIEYGFSFQNNKAKAFGISSSLEVAHTGVKTFKIERSNNTMKFYMDGTLIYSEQIDPTEYLQVRALLKSNNSTISNVLADFSTKRISVTPTIDLSNKTFNLSNSVSNTQVEWIDGNKGTTSKKFILGSFPYTLTDDNQRKLEREISLGNAVGWTNLNGVTQNGGALEKTSGSGWGTAISTASYPSNTTFWMESLIQTQNDSKAFGFINGASTLINNVINLLNPFQNTNHLVAGFIISKDHQLQLIYNGQVIRTVETFENDVIQLKQVNGLIDWKLNGLSLEQRSTTVQDFKMAALLKNGTSFTSIRQNTDLQYVTVNWNPNTYQNNINISISNIPNISGNFRYYLGTQRIPDYSEITSYTFDSIYRGDSTKAIVTLQGTNNLAFNFENVDMGPQFYAVFDQIGQRILGGRTNVDIPVLLDNNQGMQVDNNKFKSVQANAFTASNLKFDERVLDGKITFIVKEVAKKNAFGLIDPANPTQIVYGYVIENRRIKEIKDAVIGSGEGEIINKNAVVELSKQADKLILYINGVQKDQILNLNPDYVLKAGVQAEAAGIDIVKGVVKVNAKPYVYKANHTLSDCSNQNNTISFRIMGGLSYTYTIKNFLTGTTYASGSASSNQDVIYNNVPSGIYILTGNIGTTNSPIYETIELGTKAEFTLNQNYDYSPNSYSLSKNLVSVTAIAKSLSRNELKSGVNGWVVLSPYFFKNGGNSYLSITSSMNVNIGTGTYINFFKTNTGSTYYGIIYNNGQAIQTTYVFTDNDRILINIGNTISIYKNNVLMVSNLTRPGGNLHVNTWNDKFKDGYQDMIFSFLCKEPIISYIKPVDVLDAGHYEVNYGKIGIYFEEEYQIDANKFIPMKLYNQSHELIKESFLNGSGNFFQTAYKSGSNKFVINLTPLTLTPNQFYTIEIALISGEKKFVKFYYKN